MWFFPEWRRAVPPQVPAGAHPATLEAMPTPKQPPVVVAPAPAGVRHEVLTADGWRLSLVRDPARKAVAGRPPVLLIHGLLSNHRIWGLPGGPDLVDTLTKAGWDVWRLDLRGTATSTPPEGRAKAFDFSVDDHIHGDVPAALEAVCRLTGAPKVILGGHSMGGLISLGVAQQPALTARIQGLLLVAPAIRVGDPTGEGPASSVQLHRAGAFAGLVPKDLRYPADELAAWALRSPGSPAAKVLMWRGRRALWAPDQVDEALGRRVLLECVGGSSSNVLYQFGRFARSLDTMSYAGRKGSRPSAFHQAHGPWSYRGHLKDVTVPVRILGGEVDRLVRFAHLEAALADLGSRDKVLRAFPGHGHVDLLLGKDAPGDTYPWILQALGELSALR